MNKKGFQIAVVSIVLGLAFGYVVGGVVGDHVNADEETAPPSAFDLVIVLAAVTVLPFVTIAVHELGHVLGGLAAGMRFILYIVGPLRVTKSRTGLEVGLNRQLALWGGLAALYPTDDRRFVRDMKMLVAGGPIASLVLAVVCWLGWWLVPPDVEWLRMLLGGEALFSAMIFLVTAVPMRTGAFLTDGAQYLSLIRNRRDVRQRAATVRLMARSMTGERPRDWPASDLDEALDPEGLEAFRTGALILAYYRNLDAGDVDAAGRDIDAICADLSSIPDGFRQAFVNEAAFHAAWHRSDPAAARRWEEQARDGIVQRHQRERVSAAIAFAEGRDEDAVEHVARGRAALDSDPDVGSATAQRDWLDEIGRAAEARLRASVRQSA